MVLINNNFTMREKIEYIIPVDILLDWQVDKPRNRVYSTVDNVKCSVDLLLTQKEYEKMQTMHGVTKQIFIRELAINEMCRKENLHN